LFKGSIPSKVLFLGEGPGESEDVLGKPFIGPAGDLLDYIISKATAVAPMKFAYSNLIACIPRDEEGMKVTRPPKFAIDACADRLRELTHLVNPKLVVWVGNDAEKYGTKILKNHSPAFATVKIIHPGAILRGPEAGRGLAIRQSIVKLKTVLETIKC
jgi:DNA polymerase